MKWLRCRDERIKIRMLYSKVVRSAFSVAMVVENFAIRY